MEMEITLPDELPAMTLPDVAFFPQALLPLHIFEPRYRQMLNDVLSGDRLFAVAGINPTLAAQPGQFEPPHRIASVGIIRACQENDDGTSNLLLQGLCRVELLRVVTDTPYRRIGIRAIASEGTHDASGNSRLRTEVLRLLELKRKFGAPISPDIAGFLRTIEDPETFVDLAAFSLCEDPRLRQRLLETLDLHSRLALFIRQLRDDLDRLRLQRKLQGRVADDDIALN